MSDVTRRCNREEYEVLCKLRLRTSPFQILKDPTTNDFEFLFPALGEALSGGLMGRKHSPQHPMVGVPEEFSFQLRSIHCECLWTGLARPCLPHGQASALTLPSSRYFIITLLQKAVLSWHLVPQMLPHTPEPFNFPLSFFSHERGISWI